MGIFRKKDTDTISGEDKYKGWGNSKEKVFETEAQRRAVEGMAGGDLKGKDFRALKRSVHKQKRLNRRALRRAERRGIDPSQVRMKGGQYKELGRREQAVEDYFKDLRKERVENTAEIAAIAAGTIATAGALGAGPLITKALTKAGGKEALRQFGKRAAKKAVDQVSSNALTSGGAQGAVNSDPVNLPPQPQVPAYMQSFMPQQQFVLPPQYNQQPVYTMPESMMTPSYTASQVYNPFD